MEYRKEREFMVAYDENGNLRGKWNIVENTYIGVRGTPIKSIPVAFKTGHGEMPEYLENALLVIHNNNYYYDSYNTVRGQRIEQLISLNLVISNDWSSWRFLLEDKTSLTKELVNYLKLNHRGIYSEKNILEYKFWKKHNALMNKYPEHREWIANVMCVTEDEKSIPASFTESMINRAIHEKIFSDESGSSFAHLIKEWVKMVTEMGDTLEVKPNILTNFTILKYLYKEWKVRHYDDNLKKYNDLKCLYYENDEYIVRPLITRTEFHEEAEAQHNCVEYMYMEQVANGYTHVVVVRKKNYPNQSYITCEVNNNGRIIQYLYACNQNVRNEKDRTFKKEYQDYLFDHFNNK